MALALPEVLNLNVYQNVLTKWVGHCALRDWPILAPPFLCKLLDINIKMLKGSDWIGDLHKLQWEEFPMGPSGYVERHYYPWWTEGPRYLSKAPDSLSLAEVLHLFRSQVYSPATSLAVNI